MTREWQAFLERIDPEYREPIAALAQAMPADFRSLPPGERRALAEANRPAAPERTDVEWYDAGTDDRDGGRVAVRVYRPAAVTTTLPGILYLHGGGMWAGSVRGDHAAVAELAAEQRVVVVSVDYRLAPEHPYPAAAEDCVAALRWLHRTADQHGIDPSRVCVYGPSAGGGLAIATALAARDEGLPIAQLMAIYPMIDDRDATPSAHEITGLGPAVWDREANREAWCWYLGGADADPLAAPSRAEDLRGLPPTFIDVGELDLFRDEDIAFAVRLLQAGVPTELHVHPGAFHGSEAVAPDAALSRRIRAARADAMQRILHPAQERKEADSA